MPEEPEDIDGDLPPIGEGNTRMDAEGGPDIFAEAEQEMRPRVKNPSDYDIPLF